MSRPKDGERAHKGAGLRIIGVHSPEFAFERKRGDVVSGAEELGVTWPVALDDDLATWDDCRNQYDRTEKMIRELLRQADPTVTLPAPTGRACWRGHSFVARIRVVTQPRGRRVKPGGR
ncbi:hypothetical protein ACFV6B_17360 [Streptomyces microflavus]|uniref:hypothetical protein n=1 Tax=Streptomyces microflavus TaxID=1919 RepID=UPI00364C5FC7